MDVSPKGSVKKWQGEAIPREKWCLHWNKLSRLALVAPEKWPGSYFVWLKRVSFRLGTGRVCKFVTTLESPFYPRKS